MINLRYHIVSLVAVFLALALGVIAGTTVADQGVVRLLSRQTRALENQRDEAERLRRAAEQEVQLWERFAAPIVPRLMRGELTGRDVVLLIHSGVGDELVEDVSTSVATAGGAVAGLVRFSERWPLVEEAARADLATALSSSEQDARALLADAATRVARRLLVPSDPDVDDDLFDRLARNGFVTLEGASDVFPPARATFVVVSSGSGAPSPADTTFGLPFLRALAPRSVVAVGEPLGSAGSFVDRIRRDRELAARVATADHLDTLPGQLSIVSALGDLLAGRPAVHYGVGERTNSVAPLS